jgi:hypothetical protein
LHFLLQPLPLCASLFFSLLFPWKIIMLPNLISCIWLVLNLCFNHSSVCLFYWLHDLLQPILVPASTTASVASL